MVITILGMVADMELKFIKDRQRAGIDAAKPYGIYRGRKRMSMTPKSGFVANFSSRMRIIVSWLLRVENYLMFKGRHFDKSVILLCVQWYQADNLNLRDLKEKMAERGISLDHSTVHRWVLHFSPKLLDRFNGRKRDVTRKWNLDETYVKVKGAWFYLYRAIDDYGDTVEFYFTANRDLQAAKRFLRKALARHGKPERITIDGSQTNRMAIMQCDAENRLRRAGGPIAIRSSKYMNNAIEQDHRRVKRRIRSMLGFKSEAAARTTLAGIELVHMMRKQQGVFATEPELFGYPHHEKTISSGKAITSGFFCRNYRGCLKGRGTEYAGFRH